MPVVLESSLRAHSKRANGRVVLITGGASGIGKQVAFDFATAGANIVIGDIDAAASDNTVAEIKKAGGSAVSLKTDVTIWEEQLALFKFAVKSFGRVDFVIPCAAESEAGGFDSPGDGEVPTEPDLRAINVGQIGTIYTTKLAWYYLLRSTSKNKALIYIGALAPTGEKPLGATYYASKNGALGLTRSLAATSAKDTRVCLVTPAYPLVDPDSKIPRVPLSRISGAIFLAATDPDRKTNGSVYALPSASHDIVRSQAEDIDVYTVGLYRTMRIRFSPLLGFRSRIKKIVVRIRSVVCFPFGG